MSELDDLIRRAQEEAERDAVAMAERARRAGEGWEAIDQAVQDKDARVLAAVEAYVRSLEVHPTKAPARQGSLRGVGITWILYEEDVRRSSTYNEKVGWSEGLEARRAVLFDPHARAIYRAVARNQAAASGLLRRKPETLLVWEMSDGGPVVPLYDVIGFGPDFGALLLVFVRRLHDSLAKLCIDWAT